MYHHTHLSAILSDNQHPALSPLSYRHTALTAGSLHQCFGRSSLIMLAIITGPIHIQQITSGSVCWPWCGLRLGKLPSDGRKNYMTFKFPSQQRISSCDIEMGLWTETNLSTGNKWNAKFDSLVIAMQTVATCRQTATTNVHVCLAFTFWITFV